MSNHAEDTHQPNAIASNEAVKEITSSQAWQLLQDKKTLLIDVRTEQELPDAGQPTLPNEGGEYHLISWRLAPNFQANPHFIESLKQTVNKSQAEKLLFICRSGGRSYEAAQAAMAEGFTESYNVTDGMDGEQGWKASNMAWSVK